MRPLFRTSAVRAPSRPATPWCSQRQPGAFHPISRVRPRQCPRPPPVPRLRRRLRLSRLPPHPRPNRARPLHRPPRRRPCRPRRRQARFRRRVQAGPPPGPAEPPSQTNRAVKKLSDEIGVSVVAGIFLNHVQIDRSRGDRFRLATRRCSRGRNDSQQPSWQRHSFCQTARSASQLAPSIARKALSVTAGLSQIQGVAGSRRRMRPNQLRSVSAIWRTNP